MRSGEAVSRRYVALRRSQSMARLAALLWIACGALVGVSALLFPSDHGSRTGVLVVGAIANVIGALVWVAPWDRWWPRSTLVLVPVACAVIAAFNTQAQNPWVSGLFFVAAFVWTGLAHPQGTCMASAPLLLAAYLAPDFVRQDPGGTTAAAFLVPTAVLLGEASAWVSARLLAAEADVERAAARFAALVRHAGEFVVVIRDGRIVYASPGVSRVLGYDVDAALDQAPAATCTRRTCRCSARGSTIRLRAGSTCPPPTGCATPTARGGGSRARSATSGTTPRSAAS